MNLSDLIPRWQSGVYALIHAEIGIVYVGGSARCIYNRVTWHMCMLRKGAHTSSRLQELWNRDSSLFEVAVLDFCDPVRVKDLEKKWSGVCRTDLSSHPAREYTRSEAECEKIRQGRQRYLATPESRAQLAEKARQQHREKNFGAHTWRTR